MGNFIIAVVSLVKTLFSDDMGIENSTTIHLDPRCYETIMRVRY